MDNPSYGISGDKLNDSHDSSGYQQIPALSNNQNARTQNGQQLHTDSLQERIFDNPIYGSERVEEREFENPIYSTDDSAAREEAEPEDHYTIPDSPLSNVYDRVALGGTRVGVVSTGGEDSDGYDRVAGDHHHVEDDDGGMYSTVVT